MIYVFEKPFLLLDELYHELLNTIPSWRREQVEHYKRMDDRKQSLLAFVLLQYALLTEYGISEFLQFRYNEFGKPSLIEIPVHFSFSHCRDAVACVVSAHNIGVDVESISPYNPDIAKRVCTTEELAMLKIQTTPEQLFAQYWTTKEAIAKFEGTGLSLGFSGISTEKYLISSWTGSEKNYIGTVCYGKDSDAVMPPIVQYVVPENLIK